MLLGIESFILMAAIFIYENKLKKLNNDYDALNAEFNWIYSSYCKKAYDSEHNAIHYELDKVDALEGVIRNLKKEIESFRNAQPIQYESSGWNTDSWKSMPEPLSKDEWNNKWAGVHGDPSTNTNPIYGHTPYTRDWHIKDKRFDPNFE
jgi:hypothetical protein